MHPNDPVGNKKFERLQAEVSQSRFLGRTNQGQTRGGFVDVHGRSVGWERGEKTPPQRLGFFPCQRSMPEEFSKGTFSTNRAETTVRTRRSTRVASALAPRSLHRSPADISPQVDAMKRCGGHPHIVKLYNPLLNEEYPKRDRSIQVCRTSVD